jgi:tetratricopeptide (TPR) repeat protein
MGVMSLFDPFGTSPGSSLSWSQHAALTSTARSSAATARASAAAAAAGAAIAIETRKVRLAVETVGMEVAAVGNAVRSMEGELGLRLDQQSEIMCKQLELLANIAEALRTPARTRAAERVNDAGLLLRRGRYERAVTIAEQAIDDDPNNAAAFMAAAWAYLGLDNPERARELFRECAKASDDDGAQRALRQAARLTFALDGAAAAVRELPINEQAGKHERGATAYDHAVYQFAQGKHQEACESLAAACVCDRRFCLMALIDPLLDDDRLTEVATDIWAKIESLANAVSEQLRRADEAFASLRAEMVSYELVDMPPIGDYIGPDLRRAAADRYAELVTDRLKNRQEFERSLESLGLEEGLEHANAVERELEEIINAEPIRLVIDAERKLEQSIQRQLSRYTRKRSSILLARTRECGGQYLLLWGTVAYRQLSGRIRVAYVHSFYDVSDLHVTEGYTMVAAGDLNDKRRYKEAESARSRFGAARNSRLFSWNPRA